MLIWFIQSLIMILLSLGSVAFLTLLERKVLGLSQSRLGPNKTSYWGLLQPLADGLKLLWKATLYVLSNQKFLFFFSPLILLVFLCFVWCWILPWSGSISFKYTTLMYFSLLGLGAYVVILTGWSSVSGFAKAGSLRGMLQSLAFEVCLMLLMMSMLSAYKGFFLKNEDNLTLEGLLLWVSLWVLLSLMETNRAPFDLLEGESELISGFNIEMSSYLFVFLFLGEYGMVLVMALVASLVTSGEISSSYLFVFLFLIFMRSCFPRVRYDVMMMMMWVSVLPCTLLLFLIMVIT